MHRTLILLILCVPQNLLAGQPSLADVERWAEQLDAERFELRQHARQQLIKAGAISVDVLAKKLATKQVEGSRLGLSVLRELALQRDPKASAHAERLIRELADNGVTGSSYRAAAVLRSVNEMRSPMGIKILRQLGAGIRFEQGSFEEKALENALGRPLVFVTFGDAWRGSTADLFFLDWLNDYRGCKVTFEGKRFQDEALVAIKDNQKVVGIHLKRTGMTNAGISHTKSMEKLRHVIFQHCNLTAGSLEHLDREPSLSLFYVFGSAMPRSEFDSFAKKHENCVTRFGLGGFLGIGGEPYVSDGEEVRGCRILMVSENQAADRAGIQLNDIITKYDGRSVTAFMPDSLVPGRLNSGKPTEQGPSLAELIGQNSPGDHVTITLLRENQEMEIEVKLGDWP